MLKVQGNWFRKFGDWMSWIAIDFAFSEHDECRSNDGDLSIGAAGVLKLCDEIGKGKVMTSWPSSSGVELFSPLHQIWALLVPVSLTVLRVPVFLCCGSLANS